MALTSTIEYCTDRQVQDVYPNLAQHDLKRRLYNWVSAGGNEWKAQNTGLVSVLFANGEDKALPQLLEDDVDATDEWFYDSNQDFVRYYSTTDPNTMIMEAGDDWTTIKRRIRRKASRLIESRLDFRMAREVVKDREGFYPETIIHAAALQSVILHLKAADPTNEVIEPFKNDLDEILEGLSTGKIVLPTAISVDSSKGVIREVSASTGTLRPVELRGNYTGTGYELLKIKIVTGEQGVIGTSKMTVYGKSSTLLKSEILIDSEIITGDFQSLGLGNLFIRWGGDDHTAETYGNDEYEIEFWGDALDVSVPSAWSVEATRQ